jgi:hypothetical protein
VAQEQAAAAAERLPFTTGPPTSAKCYACLAATNACSASSIAVLLAASMLGGASNEVHAGPALACADVVACSSCSATQLVPPHWMAPTAAFTLQL